MLFPGGFFYLVLKPRLGLLIIIFNFTKDILEETFIKIKNREISQLLAINSRVKPPFSDYGGNFSEIAELIINNIVVISGWIFMCKWLGLVFFLSFYSMSELSKKIIESKNLKEKIDFFFETLIVDMKFSDKEWLITSKNVDKFKAKYLICSTNLLLHKRSLKILNVNQIPLRKAIPINNDKKIDLLLNFLEEQTFIPRLTFLIYTNENYSYKDFYYKKQRYFYLKNNLEKKYRFERIIFQQQDNNKLGIVVHSKNSELINSYISSKDEESFKQKIIINFNKLFEGNSIVNKLTLDEKISIMKWRASQPSCLAVPLSLQFSRKYRIGFCGDWFEGDGFARIEGSILSALILEKKIKDLIK